MGDRDDEDEKPPANDGDVIGSTAVRPVFLGNLITNYSTDAVKALFETPRQPSEDAAFEPFPVDRVDLKRGYCFVFLKDMTSQKQKDDAERFVSEINGMDVASVSRSIRAEFARGDGRIKRKEDERRKNIAPSETLFVVNFHEETTKREDLQMLFEPYGQLVRIDMKRNYAFVQFKSIEEAKKAKESTNGGKLDQSVLTVEYVARQRMHDDVRGGGDRRGPPRRRDDRRPPDDRRGGGGGRYDSDRWGGGGGGRNDDRYRHRGGPPPSSSSSSRYDDRRGGGRYDDDGGSGGYRRGYRSRSRSPPRRYRSNSRDRYDDRGGGSYRDRSPGGYNSGGRGYR